VVKKRWLGFIRQEKLRERGVEEEEEEAQQMLLRPRRTRTGRGIASLIII